MAASLAQPIPALCPLLRGSRVSGRVFGVEFRVVLGVQDSGLRAEGLELRASGSGLRVEGLGCRGLGFRVLKVSRLKFESLRVPGCTELMEPNSPIPTFQDS